MCIKKIVSVARHYYTVTPVLGEKEKWWNGMEQRKMKGKVTNESENESIKWKSCSSLL